MTAVVACSADGGDEDSEELPTELVVPAGLEVVAPENTGSVEEMAAQRLRLSEESDAGG